jgi:hypothetical protein
MIYFRLPVLRGLLLAVAAPRLSQLAPLGNNRKRLPEEEKQRGEVGNGSFPQEKRLGFTLSMDLVVTQTKGWKAVPRQGFGPIS